MRKVICAATQLPSGLTLVGARHCDSLMREQAKAANQKYALIDRAKNEGFIDQFGKFMTREEAWFVAQEAGQIIKLVGNQTQIHTKNELFSENLY